MIRLTWLRFYHEHRNHYLQYGLNLLAEDGEIVYTEDDLANGADYGLPRHVVEHDFKHLSVVIAESGSVRRVLMIDNEDSHIHLRPLIRDSDRYVLAPYSGAFHGAREFPRPYAWQSEDDLAFYRAESARLIAELGEHFSKCRALAPTPTAMDSSEAGSKQSFVQRVSNKFRWQLAGTRGRSDILRLRRREKAASRYARMLSYRNCTLKYDIVLRESAWGWPEHRVRLHQRIQELAAEGAQAYSSMSTPGGEAGRELLQKMPAAERRYFEEVLTKGFSIPDDFETAITSSRLACFATGYHFGWRGIMFVSLCAGIPILIDRPIYEPYFDMKEFQIWFNEDTEWRSMPELLRGITPESWASIKAHNQRVFDERLSPRAMAKEFIHIAEESLAQ